MNKNLLTSIFYIVFFLGSFLSSFSQGFKVSKITFQENKKLKNNFLYKLIEVREGDILDSIAIADDVKRLKRLPATSHSYYQVHKKEDGYHIVYGVQENFTIIPQFNFYNTTDGELAVRVGVNEYNFLGRNISVGVLYQNDIYNSYGFNFIAPYLFNRSLGVAINYSNLTTKEPVFLNNGNADYRYNNTSYELLALYQLNLQHRFEIGGSFFTEDYQYLEGATAIDVPQDFKVDKLLYKLVYEYNNLDYFFQYTSGFKNLIKFQYVVSTEDVLPNFTFILNDSFYFKRIGEKGNWASRLRLGIASNDESPFAPFAVDNNLNIRGVGNTIDRGTGVIVLNTEYRHTLIDKKWFILQSNIFVDAGSWRNPGGDFGDFGEAQNFRVYPGLGFRFIHKRIFNAVFRMDYGHGITKDSTRGLVFGIGQYF